MTWPILAALGVFLAVWLHEDAETRLGALASHDRRRGAAADRGARGKPWPVGHMRMVHDAGHRVGVVPNSPRSPRSCVRDGTCIRPSTVASERRRVVQTVRRIRRAPGRV